VRIRAKRPLLRGESERRRESAILPRRRFFEPSKMALFTYGRRDKDKLGVGRSLASLSLRRT
jgi:hypothetical protein